MKEITENDGWRILVDQDCRYRYRLARTVSNGALVGLFVMLNPSTRNHEERKTPYVTRKKCEAFARIRGWGTSRICNLFAWPSRKPWGLRCVDDPIGPDNDRYIREAVREAGMTVCAWGGGDWRPLREKFIDRVRQVVAILEEEQVHDRLFALGPGLTKKGHPRHPSRLGKQPDCTPVRIRDGCLEICKDSDNRTFDIAAS